MLKGVEEVCFIDNFVVDKKNFLDAYKISPESGKLFMYDTYFKNSGKEGGTVYETELGNKLYYSEMQPDSTLSILSRNRLLDKWSDGSLLPGNINEAMNANYPMYLRTVSLSTMPRMALTRWEDMTFSSPVTIQIPTLI